MFSSQKSISFAESYSATEDTSSWFFDDKRMHTIYEYNIHHHS